MKKQARKSPEFIKQLVIYQMFLRPFTPQGTIAAASKMLPHISNIGADIVYLCPIAAADDDNRTEFWSERQKRSALNNPKNPYRMKDYFAIDEEYGTDSDLRAFVKKAHSLGLKVILDLVYLHCGPTAVFIEEHPDFVHLDEKGNVVSGPWHFPLLNFESAGLRNYLWDNMEYFVREFDVDGYRCDVGDKCPLDFWEAGRERIQALKPDIIMLNEGVNPEHLLKAFDINYDFRWSEILLSIMKNNAPASELSDYWHTMSERLPLGGRCLRALENHDIANDSYEDRIEAVIGPKAVEAALVINFSMDGIPFLYNGCEIADTNKHSILGNRYFGKNLTINWANALTAEGKSRLNFIRTITNLRHTERALAHGEVAWLQNNASEAVVSFSRNDSRQNVATVVNTGSKPLTVTVDIQIEHPEVTQIILSYGTNHSYDNGKLKLDMLPYGYLLLEF